MQTITGWVGLALVVYINLALFYIASGTKRAIQISADSETLDSEASEVLKKGYRAGYLWIKNHREKLPTEASNLANRVVAINYSCWVAAIVLIIIYGLQFL